MKKLSRFLAVTLLTASASFVPTQSAQAFFGWMMPWNWFSGPGWGWWGDDYYYPYYYGGGPWGYHRPYWGGPWGYGGYPYGGAYPYWGGYQPYWGAPPVVVQQPAAPAASEAK